MFDALLFVVSFSANWFLIGLSWFLQIVHYPLFKIVSPQDFTMYGRGNTYLSLMILMPLMGVELITACLLVLFRPEPMTAGEALFGLSLVIGAWLITVFLVVPAQRRLSDEYDEDAHQALILSSWLRTLAWTLRGLTLIFAAYRAILWPS